MLKQHDNDCLLATLRVPVVGPWAGSLQLTRVYEIWPALQ